MIAYLQVSSIWRINQSRIEYDEKYM